MDDDSASSRVCFSFTPRSHGLFSATTSHCPDGVVIFIFIFRFLLQILAVFAGLGCLLTIDFSWAPYEFTQWQYMVGVGLTFVAMQAHEGVVMSITSKIIPAELAR